MPNNVKAQKFRRTNKSRDKENDNCDKKEFTDDKKIFNKRGLHLVLIVVRMTKVKDDIVFTATIFVYIVEI